jgi:hypothetical protein
MNKFVIAATLALIATNAEARSVFNPSFGCMAERLRGRRAVVQRKRRLQAEPLL